MRVAITDAIYNVMKKDKNVYFLIGDLGYHAVEAIEKDFPDRFINPGVAEQGMIGIAAGLALSGKKVYIYSIIPFVTMRCFEQVRNDICYHNLDITLLGAGSGLSYGVLGSTHFALEDVSIMRALPNMSVFEPCDKIEARLGIEALAKVARPVYIRIGERNNPSIYDESYHFEFGKGQVVREGKEIVILGSGTIMSEAKQAIPIVEDQLKKKVGLISIHTVKPIDEELVKKVVRKAELVVVIEEHFTNGGLGTAVIEVLSDAGITTRVLRIGLPNEFVKEIGEHKYLRHMKGFDTEGIAKSIVEKFNEK